MKKKTLMVLLVSLFLILFNVMFFMLGGHVGANASRWVSYGAIHAAYLLMVFTPTFNCAGKIDRIFGLPITTASVLYFAVEFVVGLLFVLFNPVSVKAAVIIQLIVFVFYAACLLTLMIANASAEEAEAEKLKPGVFKDRAGKLLADARKRVKKDDQREAVDAVSLCLTATPDETREVLLPLEADIVSSIKDLRVAAEKKDAEAVIALSGDIRGMLERRTAALAQVPAAEAK